MRKERLELGEYVFGGAAGACALVGTTINHGFWFLGLPLVFLAMEFGNRAYNMREAEYAQADPGYKPRYINGL